MKESDRKLLIGLLLLFGIAALLNIFFLVKSIFWPYSIDYSEGVVSIMKISYLYKSFSTYPYLITYYPPLFYLLIDLFRDLLPSSLPYLYSRSLTFFATMLIGAFMYLITKRTIGSDKLFGIFAPLLFLSSTLVLYFGISPNPIMFELLFDLVALFFIIYSKDRKSLLYAAVALGLAFLFRQSALEIFAAIVAYLLINRRFEDCMFFAAIFSVIFILIVLPLNLITDGRFVFSVFVLPLITPPSLYIFLTNVENFFFETPIMLLIPLSLYYIYKRPKSLLSITLVVLSVFSLSAFKIGSDYIYFVPVFCISCITSAVAFTELISSRHKPIPIVAFNTFVTLLLIYGLASISMHAFFSETPSGSSLVGLSLRNLDGPMLAETPDVAIFANKTVLFEPSMFWVMKNEGVWNDAQIISDISTHKFAAVVFPNYSSSEGRLSNYPDIINATDEYYFLNYSEYGWNVYTPRP